MDNKKILSKVVDKVKKIWYQCRMFMTKKQSPPTSYRQMQEEAEENYVKEVLSPLWKRGKGKTLREIAKIVGTSHEQVRLLLIQYGEYE